MDLMTVELLTDYVRTIIPDEEDTRGWPNDAKRFYYRIETFTYGLILGIGLMKPLRFPDEEDGGDEQGQRPPPPPSGGPDVSGKPQSHRDPTDEELRHIADMFRKSQLARRTKD